MSKDKKQLVVVGILVVVVLAIGAFQFMGPKPAPATQDEPKKEKADDETLVAENAEKADPMKLYIDSLIAGASSPRDPFQPQAVVIDEPTGHEDQNNSQVTPYQPNGGQRPDPEIGGGFKPYDPTQGTGEFGNAGLGGNNSTTVEPAPVNNGMPFALRGVMIGRTKKMCMLELTDGRQVLAVEGQSFGSDHETTVMEIHETNVVLKHRGKVHNLALLGGN